MVGGKHIFVNFYCSARPQWMAFKTFPANIFNNVKKIKMSQAVVTTTTRKEKKKKKISKIVATFVYASSQGQRTLSARTKIIQTLV
jgi:hypothetical protein